QAVLQPAADGAVREGPARLAVARIVEADDRPALVPRPGVERRGLGPFHVGVEAAQPEQAGRRALARANRNAARGGAGSHVNEFQATIAHRQVSVEIMLTGFPAMTCFAVCCSEGKSAIRTNEDSHA